MKIRMNTLKKGQNNIELCGNAPNDDCTDMVLLGPQSATGSADFSDDALYLQLGVSAPVELECSRCLEPFSYKASTRLNAVYSWKKKLSNEEGDTYFELIDPEAKEIDLSQIIRESIILCLPMKPLCSENCKGLCSRCGGNLNSSGACNCKAAVELATD